MDDELPPASDSQQPHQGDDSRKKTTDDQDDNQSKRGRVLYNDIHDQGTTRKQEEEPQNAPIGKKVRVMAITLDDGTVIEPEVNEDLDEAVQSAKDPTGTGPIWQELVGTGQIRPDPAEIGQCRLDPARCGTIQRGSQAQAEPGSTFGFRF